MSQSQKIPWTRIFVEGAAIVASILFAFAIDAWWDDRQQDRLETDLLLAVMEEVNENLAELKRHIDGNVEDLRLNDLFFRSTPEELSSIDRDSIEELVTSFHRARTFTHIENASTMVLRTPASDVSGIEIRNQIAMMLRILVDTIEDRERVILRQEHVRSIVALYAAKVTNVGLHRVGTTVAGADQNMLAELRTDSELVAAILDKAHIQDVYLRELRRAEVALRTFRDELEATVETR